MELALYYSILYYKYNLFSRKNDGNTEGFSSKNEGKEEEREEGKEEEESPEKKRKRNGEGEKGGEKGEEAIEEIEVQSAVWLPLLRLEI